MAFCARYRESFSEPTLLEPGRVYELHLDLWATSNLGWCLAQITLNILSVSFSAMLPDQVPNKQLGKVTGYARMMPFIATVTGIVIASLFVSRSAFLMFMIPAAIGLLTCLPLAFLMSDRPLHKEEIDPFHISGIFGIAAALSIVPVKGVR
jgi:hypothetical protein